MGANCAMNCDSPVHWGASTAQGVQSWCPRFHHSLFCKTIKNVCQIIQSRFFFLDRNPPILSNCNRLGVERGIGYNNEVLRRLKFLQQFSYSANQRLMVWRVMLIIGRLVFLKKKIKFYDVLWSIERKTIESDLIVIRFNFLTKQVKTFGDPWPIRGAYTSGLSGDPWQVISSIVSGKRRGSRDVNERKSAQEDRGEIKRAKEMYLYTILSRQSTSWYAGQLFTSGVKTVINRERFNSKTKKRVF